MKYPLIPALALVMLSACPAHSDMVIAKITEAECKADYAAMVTEAQQNRLKSLDELNTALRDTTDAAAAETLNHLIQQTWEVEESFLKLAANVRRDCLKYARSKAS